MEKSYNLSTPQDIEFGRRLEEIVNSRGLKQKDFGKLIDRSPPVIHHWFYGIREMRISMFAKAVDALQMTTSEMAYLLEAYWENGSETK